MSWGRIDDGMPEHPKWVALEERFGGRVWVDAMALWVTALCYANRHETDGEVSRSRLLRLTPLDADAATAAADAMVSCGLMVVTENGYAIHDFLRFNKSREQKEMAREAEAERGRVRRASKDRPPRVHDGRGADSAPESTPASTPASTSRPTPPDPDPDPNSSLRSDRARAPTDRELRGLGLLRQSEGGSLVAMWASAYAEAHRREAGKVWLSARAIERIVAGDPERPHEKHAAALDALAGWLAEVPSPEREATIAAVLAGAWADPWMRERGCPLSALASNPSRYAGSRTGAAAAEGDPPNWHPVTHGAPKDPRNFRAWNTWTDAGCPPDPTWAPPPRRAAGGAS